MSLLDVLTQINTIICSDPKFDPFVPINFHYFNIPIVVEESPIGYVHPNLVFYCHGYYWQPTLPLSEDQLLVQLEKIPDDLKCWITKTVHPEQMGTTYSMLGRLNRTNPAKAPNVTYLFPDLVRRPASPILFWDEREKKHVEFKAPWLQ
ncbi:hypothetical protein QAD02_009071 [Eretmocerus hayati]|uniref:Uncharacterized protein n=1 Tax=Eretmocerus hayati TaxID=131215 RepID=A0ACC2N8Z6_9HYME|nr:hypothetical protein QAD02_009071 [Eretmocerus hayati]